MDTIFADITVSVTELNRNSRAFSNRPANAYRHLEPQPARGLPVSHYEWPMAYKKTWRMPIWFVNAKTVRLSRSAWMTYKLRFHELAACGMGKTGRQSLCFLKMVTAI
ncbi:MAG: hypothetical protein ACP5J5_07825 [Dissulfurimicrobium sp.]